MQSWGTERVQSRQQGLYFIQAQYLQVGSFVSRLYLYLDHTKHTEGSLGWCGGVVCSLGESEEKERDESWCVEEHHHTIPQIH